jgi:hypothetical protein
MKNKILEPLLVFLLVSLVILYSQGLSLGVTYILMAVCLFGCFGLVVYFSTLVFMKKTLFKKKPVLVMSISTLFSIIFIATQKPESLMLLLIGGFCLGILVFLFSILISYISK